MISKDNAHKTGVRLIKKMAAWSLEKELQNHHYLALYVCVY
jgi:hypothetical protein